ncbi:putative ribosomal protein S30 [Helianthus annuus]|nr:putative ribosomal protein S30 [Helianthus annuus]
MCVNLIRGKVHGLMACAGKVRGQIPKVAKQDTKKQSCGRAHKHIQYNRRFITTGINSLIFLHLLCFSKHFLVHLF